MKDKELVRTNLLISIILVIGFLITAVFSYRANYQTSIESLQQISSLSMEGIYYQFTTMLTKPVNISLTMAHDRFLEAHLSGESENLDDEAYSQAIQNYLYAYREKYAFDSVFLVSAATGRYYNFNGVDRILTEGNPENDWYFQLMDSDLEYSMNVDNDEVDGSDNAITVFVNCKIPGQNGEVLGVVGVGIRNSYLNEFLSGYEEAYDVKAYLLDQEGMIEVSTTYSGYEKVDWFQLAGQENIREAVLKWKEDSSNLELWTDLAKGRSKNYVVSRYIPELSWHLVVEQNDDSIVSMMKDRMYLSILVIILVILVVMVIITTVIRNFNRQIMKLVEERQTIFKKATEQLYDNIYELNITKNYMANRLTEEYFESMGLKGMPYDQALRAIAENQIKEEYREGYIATFTPENVIRQYEAGNNHLRYDFMSNQNSPEYIWMRIDAYVFLSEEDQCLHMFIYRKNIDEDKKKELMAYFDEMTKLLTKTATRRTISSLLRENPGKMYALFLFDIDNFKQVNDSLGHSFGDFCIREFTGIIRRSFREEDVLGRVGGDEFLAFIPVRDIGWVENKLKELTCALDTDCRKDEKLWHMSASIGVAIAPSDGDDFETLYEKADAALYRTKQTGKNGYTIFGQSLGD